MHELSICQSISDIVARHAAGRPVSVIHVRIGQLRQIVPGTLVYCWALVSAETPLASSRIEVESVPASIRCHECDQTSLVGDVPVLICGCGSTKTEIASGEEFLITSLELADEPAEGASA